MANKLRKTLGKPDSPYIISLKRLIDSQSKETIARWCLDYAEAHILPIFKRRCPGVPGPRRALEASRAWFKGLVKLPAVRAIIRNECHAAARELDHDPAAQAAARACGQAASCCHTAGHALGLAYYGAAAIAYDEAGIGASEDTYDRIAALECAKMEMALLEMAARDGAILPTSGAEGDVSDFSPEELAEAHRALLSTLNKCEKVLESEKLPKAQRTLTQRRVEALRVALALIAKEAQASAPNGTPPPPGTVPPPSGG